MTGCPLLLPAIRCKHTGQPLQKTLAKTVAKKTPGPIAEKHRGTVAKNTGNRCKENAPLPKKTAQAGKTPVWKYTGYRCTKKTPILFGTITFEHDLLIFVVPCFLCVFFLLLRNGLCPQTLSNLKVWQVTFILEVKVQVWGVSWKTWQRYEEHDELQICILHVYIYILHIYIWLYMYIHIVTSSCLLHHHVCHYFAFDPLFRSGI